LKALFIASCLVLLLFVSTFLLLFLCPIKSTNEETLRYASEIGNIQRVISALNRGANIDSVNYYCETSLMIAAYRGRVDVVRHLLNSGSDVNKKNVFGITALMYAIEGGDYKIVSILLNSKANPNAIDKNGLTALMRVARKQNFDNYCESVTKILLQFGADPNIKDKNGNSCFEHAKNLINNRIFEGIETQTINNGVLRVLK
jgi:ankyrin repeat protein